MRQIFFTLCIGWLFFFNVSCDSIRYMTIQTREPALISLDKNIKSVLIVNNTVAQPRNQGHWHKQIDKPTPTPVSVNADSAAIFYTEALAQFLSEENYFDKVMVYDRPLRTDINYAEEKPIMPETMLELQRSTGTQAIISLDKLSIQNNASDLFWYDNHLFTNMTGKIRSTVRVYQSSLMGEIPTVNYDDSIQWNSYDPVKNQLLDTAIPSAQESVKLLAVNTADKMAKVFAPHWETQRRWYFDISQMGTNLMKEMKWEEALSIFEEIHRTKKKDLSKARSATNIALCYEMMENFEKAKEWAELSKNLFQSVSGGTPAEYRLSEIYLTELTRRANTRL